MNFKSSLILTGAAALTALAASFSLTASPVAGAPAEAAPLLATPAPLATAGADAALARLGDRVVGMVVPEQAVRFGLQLPYHDQAGLDVLDQRLYTPGDPLFHQFLTTQQFNERFAPSQEEYDALIALAQRSGLTVKDTHSGRTLLSVEAPAARIQQLFGVQMRQVQTSKGETYAAGDRPASLPAAFAAIGARVVSLNQRPAHPHLVPRTDAAPAAAAPASQPRAITVPDPGPRGGFGPGDIQTGYNTIGLSESGAGQTIALYELSTATYTDAKTYLSNFGLPATTYNNISFVNVDGGATDNSGALEVMLDIEMVLAMVPNIGKLIVYTGPNGSPGIPDLYTRIADDNLASVISTSWGSPEQSGGDGSEAAYQKMVTQGQALFAAAGDSGAYDNCNDTPPGTLSVDDPAVQVNVTGVGGTSVTLNSSTSAYMSETTWGNTSETSGSCPKGSGGGGGISQFTSIPSYQSGIVSNAPAGEFSTTKRNVPDVSLNAEPATGYAVYESVPFPAQGWTGGWGAVGGTSAAAPLWAAFWTQINQALKARGKPAAGFANPLIYQFAENATSYANDFHDIKDNSTNLHYHAVTGYDTATGWGSFNGANLFQDAVNFLSGGIPAAPTNVTATAGDGQLTINWTAALGATSYRIYYEPSGSTTLSSLPVSGGSTTQATITGLTNGQSYYVVMRAFNASGYSPTSTGLTATAGTVPPAPTSVTATPGDSQLTINWTASTGATSYRIYYEASGSTTLSSQVVAGGSTTQAIITGLTNGQSYYVVMRAFNASGYSPTSTGLTATAGTVPPAPTNVSATPGSGQLTINWTAATGATSYRIYYEASGASTLSSQAVAGGSTTQSTITGLSSGTLYYIVMRAFNASGYSPTSSQITGTPN